MHRRFYLENALRQRFNLQDLKGLALFTSPAGLGLAMYCSYELVGGASRVVDETSFSDPSPALWFPTPPEDMTVTACTHDFRLQCIVPVSQMQSGVWRQTSDVL